MKRARWNIDIFDDLRTLRSSDFVVLSSETNADGTERWSLEVDLERFFSDRWFQSLGTPFAFDWHTQTDADMIPLAVDVGADGIVDQLTFDFTHWYLVRGEGMATIEAASILSEFTLTQHATAPTIDRPCDDWDVVTDQFGDEFYRCTVSP